jgi:hypothetical protein
MLFKVNVVLFAFDALAGGIIALWKSVVITVKVEIGDAAAQIELREVADKRRLYLVAKEACRTWGLLQSFESANALPTATLVLSPGVRAGNAPPNRFGGRSTGSARNRPIRTLTSHTGMGIRSRECELNIIYHI